MALEAAALLILALLGSPPGHVPSQAAAPLSEEGFDADAFEAIDFDLLDSEGFLNAHPDLKYRNLGNQARMSGHYREALKYFLRAARFADKLSQGAVAEMYWNGEDVSADRALAYAWMDVAAERGSRLLLAHRERYWSLLSDSEREDAISRGEALYAEFGDEVAKKRLERILWSARRKVTGSRVGWVGNMSICVDPSSGCRTRVTGEQYYADRYWNPDEYWDWQDRIILTPTNEGSVEIGTLEVVGEGSEQSETNGNDDRL